MCSGIMRESSNTLRDRQELRRFVAQMVKRKKKWSKTKKLDSKLNFTRKNAAVNEDGAARRLYALAGN
jgi:hypothetical protein